MMQRRHYLQFATTLIANYSINTGARSQNQPHTALLPWPADMRRAAQQANARGEPLVLMVSLPGCPWCELLRRNYLTPMRAEGVAAFELMVNDRSTMLLDFNAQRLTPAALSDALNIKITPTLLFFNTQGQEIAPRMEGVASADFIGAILDERLATARARIKAAR